MHLCSFESTFSGCVNNSQQRIEMQCTKKVHEPQVRMVQIQITPVSSLVNKFSFPCRRFVINGGDEVVLYESVASSMFSVRIHFT